MQEVRARDQSRLIIQREGHDAVQQPMDRHRPQEKNRGEQKEENEQCPAEHARPRSTPEERL